MRVSRQRVLLFWVAVAVQAHVWVADIRAQDLLAEVRAGNKSALDSIRTLFCRMTVETPVSAVNRSGTSPVDYWQSGDSLRIRFEDAFQITDAVRLKEISRTSFITLRPASEQRSVFSIRALQPEQLHGRFDPYGSGLLKLFGTKGAPLTLEAILGQPHKVKKVTKQPIEGGECIVLEMSVKFDSQSTGNFEIWFDPKVNYLARKLIGDFTGPPDRPKVRRESQVLRFVEAAPGIHFPVEAETKFINNDKLTHHEVATFSDIRINQPLPTGIFELPIPPNSKVLDAIQDREYTVDGSGKETGISRPLAKGMPAPAGKSGQAPGSAASPPVVALTATTKEPEPVTRWVLYGLLLVLAIAGGIWYVRRLRASAISG